MLTIVTLVETVALEVSSMEISGIVPYGVLMSFDVFKHARVFGEDLLCYNDEDGWTFMGLTVYFVMKPSNDIENFIRVI